MTDAALRALRHDWRTMWGTLGPHASVPEDTLVCAIGDIHGRADLVDRLHGALAPLAPEVGRRIAIYLGDYVDRGPDSRDVLDRLSGPGLEGFETIYLKGNHEEAMLRFLEEPQTGSGWLPIGGAATLESYGIAADAAARNPDELAHLSQALGAALPPTHMSFLQKLTLWHQVGDYMFVHAGIRPGLPMTRQAPKDLLWIRGPFLRSWRRHDGIIVHGHSARVKPQVRHNRIGIDTGAFATGCLTCLVLRGRDRKFLFIESP